MASTVDMTSQTAVSMAASQTSAVRQMTTASAAAPSAASNLLFTWPDYVVFAVSLAIPIVIGVFFCIRQRNKKSIESFLMGERSINFVAVALSILASLINGIFIIGTPAEMHYYGMRQSFVILGLFVAVIIASHLFVPKFSKMTYTSAYEYVEKRFNFATRVIASVVFSASVILLLAVVLYVPALVFSQVSTLNMYAAIAITGGICTIYTTIGGLKAVVYTDAVQIIILIIGLIAVAALGANKVGGGAAVWDIAMSTGRVNFGSTFSIDPRERHTLWTQMIGQGATYVSVFIANQMIIQRYMTVRSTVKAHATLYVTFLIFIPIAMLIFFIGITLHATYYKCDPLVTKKISAASEIMQYFLMDTLGEYHGLPGLLMASMFAAALGTVSAVINALAAVFLNDYIFPAIRLICARTGKPVEKVLTEMTKRNIAVGLVAFFGLLTIGLACLASKFTTQLVQASTTIWGVLDGPVAGMFIMGFFIPFCNSAGAITGMIGGLMLTLWIYIGASLHVLPPVTLPVGICRGNLTITLPRPAINAPAPVWFPLLELYKVSYSWYGFIGIASSVIIGVVVSLLTGGWRKSYTASIDPHLVNWCCCSSTVRDGNTTYSPNNETTCELHDNVTVQKITSSTECNSDSSKFDEDSGIDKDSYKTLNDSYETLRH